jgi:tetratricopeptide (TPR) repeat protein
VHKDHDHKHFHDKDYRWSGHGYYYPYWYGGYRPFYFGLYWNPLFGSYPSAYYYDSGLSGYGYPEVVASETYVEPPVTVVQEPLVEAQPAAPYVATADGLGYLRQAEDAFRAERYDDAIRLLQHALVEMPREPVLYELMSQAYFAVGDYREAAVVLQHGMSLTTSDQWGTLVKNYTRYYRGNTYVHQMNQLVAYVKEQPDQPYAWFLRGYHYGFLGYEEAARRDLAKAVALESRDELARALLQRFGGSAEVPQEKAGTASDEGPRPPSKAIPDPAKVDGSSPDAVEPSAPPTGAAPPTKAAEQPPLPPPPVNGSP